MLNKRKRMIDYMRYLCGLLVLVFCMTTFHAQGQTQLEKELVKSQQLSEKVQELTDSCNKLAERVQSMRNDLKLKQDTWNYNDRIIKDANSGVHRNNLKAQVSALENKVQDLRQDSIDLMAKKDKLVAQIKDAEDKLGNMEEARAVQAKQDADKAKAELANRYEQNKQLLKRRYSQISKEELDAISATVDDFKGMKGFAEYKKRVATAVNNKQLFEKANALLGQPYTDEVRITDDKLYALLELKNDNPAKGVFAFSKENLDGSGSQRSEMDTLEICMYRYKGGLKALQGLIKKVNTNKLVIGRDSNNQAKREECWEAINKVIESYVYTNDDGKKYDFKKIKERYFDQIPYLNNAFNQYLEQLKKSPLQTTEIEQEILSIKVK
ncbi:MAG: hypothetical protein IKW85_04770 [Muribaculaceae bacterium]|nr:hypothetical protein [Muribaculaceae bacterium]